MVNSEFITLGLLGINNIGDDIMNANWSGYLTLFLFIAIAAMGFLLWIGGLFVFWLNLYCP